jgi:hypothetical protein
MSIVSLVIAPYIAVDGGTAEDMLMDGTKTECCAAKKEMKCDMSMCADMSEEECAAYCDSVGCSPEEKAMCVKHAGKGDHSSMEGCEHGCKSKEECKHHEGEEAAEEGHEHTNYFRVYK